MKPFKLVFISLIILFANTAISQPYTWYSSGFSGGGGLFSPSISPYNDSEYFINCDMTGVYHSTNNGDNWNVIPFHQITGAGVYTKVNFTSHADTLYSFGYTGYPYPNEPLISTDGGSHWTRLISDPTWGEVFYLFADPSSTKRIIVSDWSHIYFSDNAGQTFTTVYSTTSGSGVHLAGVYWDSTNIYLGTNFGFLTSHNNGLSFSIENFTDDLPTDFGMLTLTGTKVDTTVTIFCVAKTGADIWGGYHPNGYNNADADIFRIIIDSTSGWERKNIGIPIDDFPYYVAMSNNNSNIVYAAGYSSSQYAPVIYKSTVGGDSWSTVFHTANNQNIKTGWMGHDGDFQWGWAESPFALEVAPNNPDVIITTDWGFAHTSTDGGTTWRQIYEPAAESNPINISTPKKKYFHSNGLEVTSAWWLTWMNKDDVFASYSDLTGIISHDGGNKWAKDFNYPTHYNTTYQVVEHPDNGKLYAAVSAKHDMYLSTTLSDNVIDSYTGEVYVSNDDGNNWTSLHNFEHPVIWFDIDPNNSTHFYASVVHSTQGGIYYSADSGLTWSKLTSPPRTEGHPLNIHVLDDGTLVCSFSGRLDANYAFTESSGVFVSTDNGQTWLDKSHNDMKRWTKDIVIDPYDTTQNTWYVCIFSHWGSAPNEVGGIFRTTDRGQSWSRISNIYRVSSLTIHPDNREIAYVTTSRGLYYTSNLSNANPTFALLPDFPFSFPMRVFFNPYDHNEIWVTSFGNGLKKGYEIPVNYYVSTLGDDNNSGALVSPWRNIQKACDNVPPGSNVHILAGTYNEKLSVNVSGLDGKTTSFQNFQGQSVILDGTGVSGNTMIKISNKSYLKFSGIEITNCITNNAQGILIDSSSHHIEIHNNKISNIHFSSNASDPVSSSTNSQPIIVYGNSATNTVNNIFIDNNEVFNCRTGYSEALSLDGNIDGFEVTKNIVHDITNIGIHAAGHYQVCTNPLLDQARNGIISNNITYNCLSPVASSGGIYIDGGEDIIVENNKSFQNHYGIEIGCETQGKSTSNIIVRNNLVYNNQKTGIAFGGYNYPTGSGKIDSCTIVNNTLFKNDSQNDNAGELFISYTENCNIQNNIINPTSQNIAFYLDVPPVNLSLGYNLYNCLGGASSLEFDWNGTTYIGLPAHQVGTSQDVNSTYGDSKFKNETLPEPDLHILAASDAIDRGNPTSSSNLIGAADYDYYPRIANDTVDNGAYEFYKVWTGAVNNDWNNQLNWSPPGIPAINYDIVIPAGLTNTPQLKSDSAFYIRSISIQENAIITISMGDTLVIGN